MVQRFSKARVAQREWLMALTSGKMETPAVSIKFWVSLMKTPSTDSLSDAFPDSFRVLATEIQPSPKSHANGEETQSFSLPQTKSPQMRVSMVRGTTGESRSSWSSSMLNELFPFKLVNSAQNDSAGCIQPA